MTSKVKALIMCIASQKILEHGGPIWPNEYFWTLFFQFNSLDSVKGGYLDFSHLTELKNIYITEIYMKKTIQIIKN